MARQGDCLPARTRAAQVVWQVQMSKINRQRDVAIGLGLGEWFAGSFNATLILL